jgi:hypothetical protein
MRDDDRINQDIQNWFDNATRIVREHRGLWDRGGLSLPPPVVKGIKEVVENQRDAAQGQEAFDLSGEPLPADNQWAKYERVRRKITQIKSQSEVQQSLQKMYGLEPPVEKDFEQLSLTRGDREFLRGCGISV